MNNKRLKETIKGRPDQIIDEVSKTTGVPIVWHEKPTEEELETAASTASYQHEDLDTAIGRPLSHLNQGSPDPFLEVWADEKVYLVRKSTAPALLRTVFEKDFQ